MINQPPLASSLPVDERRMAGWPRPWGQWFTQVWQLVFDVQNSGTTANRPVVNLYTGKPYFDTTLGYPIWWDGTQWVDATGTPA